MYILCALPKQIVILIGFRFVHNALTGIVTIFKHLLFYYFFFLLLFVAPIRAIFLFYIYIIDFILKILFENCDSRMDHYL